MNTRFAAVTLAACLFLFASCAFAQDQPPRVGFEENFDTADGWYLSGGAPIRSVTAEDGTVTFATNRGALNAAMKRADWPEWPAAPYAAGTSMRKDYDLNVDLSEYHYLVVKLDERGTAVTLELCGFDTPVCYTTGLRVYDLRHRNVGGKQKMRLSISFLNSSGEGTFDFVRLVRELTPEEKQVLMPPPVGYFRENLSVHPYHRLEALNARSGRERKPDAEGQLVVYEDTASRGRVWKLTDQPGDQAFRSGDSTAGWSDDGRYFNVTGGRDGRNVYDYAAGTFRETMGGGALSTKPLPQYAAMWESRDHESVVYGYRTQWHRPDVDFIFYRYDMVKGEETEFARFTTEGKWDVRELAQADKGDRAALGLRGTPNVWIIDPGVPAGKAITPITLPTRLKGLGFIHDDSALVWFNCYTYEQLVMDLATPQAGQARKVSLGYYTAGGHAGGGGGKTLRHYEGMTTIQPAGLTDWRAGDKVGIFAYYKDPIDTDYGRLIDGARWWLTNGTSGDVSNQHILVDGKDCATVLRLCGYNSSRNSWSTNTYSIASPDATKVAWVSDQLGDGDVMVVVARKPDAPKNIRMTRMIGLAAAVSLTWEKPERSQETAGYIVYGAPENGPFAPIARVTDTIWVGAANADRFLVMAEEWSGLESLPVGSSQALHLDVWEGERSKTARAVFDGRASATRCVRYFKAAENETEEATVTWRNVNAPGGEKKLWMRQRADRVGSDWDWKPITKGFSLGRDKSVKVTIPQGILVDKVIVTDDPNYVPKTIDDRFPAPAQVADAKATFAADGTVTLTWAKPDLLAFSHVEIFADTKPDFACANETVVGAVTAAQKQVFIDWGLKPGSTVTYKLVRVDGQDLRSKPVDVTVKIPAVEKLVYTDVPAGRGKTGPNLVAIDRADEEFIGPRPIAPLKDADPKTFVPLALPFDVPVAGRYTIWVRYSPGYTRRMNVACDLDGRVTGDWNVRPPYRPMSAMWGVNGGTERIYVDRLHVGAADVFTLDAGKHTLTFRLDPAMEGGQVHAISRIWITNDPSFRPDGWNPRADFEKRRQ